MPSTLPHLSRTDVPVRIGDVGFVVRHCLPSGTAVFEGRAVDVVSDGGFIPEGASVEVVSVAAGRVEVAPFVEDLL